MSVGKCHIGNHIKELVTLQDIRIFFVSTYRLSTVGQAIEVIVMELSKLCLGTERLNYSYCSQHTGGGA